MADEVINGEALSLKHKKERKELQAQIQNLKKSICKGDKKRKKEITEEIAQLEIDLDKKQEQEIINSKLKEAPVENEHVSADDNQPEQTQQRISKAQKRRDKKSNAEKERYQRIIEQEAENVNGKRNVETQAIIKILQERHLRIHEIPSDGHCLYNAVSHQLREIGDIPLGFKTLRVKTSEYLKANMNDFVPFLHNAESEETLSPEQYTKYCDDVAGTTAWGGAVELQVLSQVLKCPIEVIQATGAPYVIGEEYKDEGKKVTLTYHRHMYGLGAHYNSVTKFAINEES
ncbi:deubiquitinase OTUD6B [Neodiprion virginianus]|uniref:deubiquitinase OTUD6B n=1 Tax=Neodiprion virginianus TaxID=2961670 RepID=UPI001EE73058|nr:deubiquitinase OTUD6B [Neodiprion virginianus]